MRLLNVSIFLRRISIACIIYLLPVYVSGLNITIVSSQPEQTYQNMDSIWREVALQMGHSPVIVPQSILSNNLFFSTTDVLIISNGIIGLFADEENIILQFLKSGKSVYLQSEYNPYMTTNQAFTFIVNSLGGEFAWKNMFEYDLGHVNVLGSFSTNKNTVNSLTYFWHSVSGKGDCNMYYFLEHGGEYHGFQYVPKNPNYGSIITIPDQNWIFERNSLPLMENIITHLISPPTIPEENNINLGNDTVLCAGEELLLDFTHLTGVFVWQDNSIHPSYNVKQEGKYWVNATLLCGTVTDTISVSINYCDCEVYIPNIFSPDNNGYNDHFKPESNCPFSEYRILIFNRWGDLLFESDKNDEWDGLFRGKPTPSGVYTYVVEYAFNADDHQQVFGNLTLLR